ncbi:MAG: hypothetical protein AAF351_06815 [Pseudomonadota bacterium]
MIVPEYWAEAKERVVVNGKARTYKRFGWSDESEDDAYRKAQERLADVIVMVRRGEKVRLVDHKTAYNGAEGLPIREEIISRRGDAVITRNGYGAACLNTPDVMFADVDVDEPSSARYGWTIFGLALLASLWTRHNWAGNGEVLSWILLATALFLSAPLGKLIHRVAGLFSVNPYDAALARIETFTQKDRLALVRIYRTPNGFRVLAMHDTFEPDGRGAQSFMRGVGGDPLYAQMCRNQKCFRARLSPKPWRIGIEEHMRPRPGVWPISEERLPDRRRWIRRYETVAANYAACRYEKTVGDGRSIRKCEDIRRLHDDLCRATYDLPIA